MPLHPESRVLWTPVLGLHASTDPARVTRGFGSGSYRVTKDSGKTSVKSERTRLRPGRRPPIVRTSAHTSHFCAPHDDERSRPHIPPVVEGGFAFRLESAASRSSSRDLLPIKVLGRRPRPGEELARGCRPNVASPGEVRGTHPGARGEPTWQLWHPWPAQLSQSRLAVGPKEVGSADRGLVAEG